MDKKRVLIVDDHQLIIDGLKGFLIGNDAYQVVGEANTGSDAIKLAEVLSPDLILMDIEMPGISGIQACLEIKKQYPETKVIIISMHNEKQLIKKIIDQGADGYLLKNSSKDEVLDAMGKVSAGGIYLSQDVTMLLVGQDNPQSSGHGSDTLAISNLTEREIEILELVAEGLTNKEIGEKLIISHRTVDTHRTNLMKKLEVTNVAGLIRFAFKNGLIQ